LEMMNVTVRKGVNKVHMSCQHLAFKQSSFGTRCTLAILYFQE
jgi:hypothetical protein